ncbi:MAG: hypothetical protein OXC60_21145 [Litoreibacter sp.]|nr:hypothetical protein [Litoreibacter sp.]
MRKLITLVLMGVSFYAGLQLERLRASDLCLDAGGSVGARGLCVGASQ